MTTKAHTNWSVFESPSLNYLDHVPVTDWFVREMHTCSIFCFFHSAIPVPRSHCSGNMATMRMCSQLLEGSQNKEFCGQVSVLAINKSDQRLVWSLEEYLVQKLLENIWWQLCCYCASCFFSYPSLFSMCGTEDLTYHILQDDSYLESYISTIGVDFVSFLVSLNKVQFLCSICACIYIYIMFVLYSLFTLFDLLENPHRWARWEDDKAANRMLPIGWRLYIIVTN
jgi:hypothetical protein